MNYEKNQALDSKVSVVILNWNGKKFLEKFIPLLVQKTTNASIVIADNASTDNSIEFVKQHYPEIKLIQLDKNYGFAGGYNKALEKVNSKYYVLLNSDIEVTDNWLAPLIEVLENNPDVVACQPKVLNYYNQDFFEYAGAAGGFIDKLGYPFCRGRIFNTFEKDAGQYDDMVEIFWATGACLAIKAEAFHKVGGFDELFFAHMEEIDLCWRLKKQGYKILVVPQSKIYHVGGGTLPKKSARKTYLNFRNNYLLLFKNLSNSEFLKIILIRICLDWAAAITFLLQLSFNEFLSVFKAQINALNLIKKHYLKTKTNNLNKKITCIYKKSIVLDYFFKQKKYFHQLSKKNFT